jgi:ribosomal protein S18 acetylase RimI-like enzyme
MAANKAAVVVAEAGGEIVGYGICQLRRRPAYFEPIEHGVISDLDVAASHRRRGVGEMMLGALCNWLAGRGLKRVEIEVATANEIAVSFWRKWGSKPTAGPWAEPSKPARPMHIHSVQVA